MHTEPHRLRAALAALLLASTIPCGPFSNAAFAGNQDLYGFGARGPGLSGAAIAFPLGFEALYYNPAGLVLGGARTFSVGFQSTLFDLHIRSPRMEDVRHLEDEENIHGITVGVDVVLPLRGALEDRIALGLGLYIPTKTLLSARIPRPYEPQFYLSTDRARSVAIKAGLAVRITDWLHVGAALRALASLRGFITVEPNETGNLSSSVEDELVTEYAAVVGALVHPHPAVAVGLVWRMELGAPYELPINADLGESTGISITVPELNISGTTVYDPGQVALHVGWHVLPTLRIEAGVTWKQWSAFPVPIEKTTSVLPALEPLDFSDTFVPRIGIEGELPLPSQTWHLRLRGGYAFEPSPVGEQPGGYTFLDGGRHVVSLGLGVGYDSPAGFGFDLDLFGQAQLMMSRTFEKVLGPASNTDAVGMSTDLGFPWIGYEGQIWCFGSTLEVRL